MIAGQPAQAVAFPLAMAAMLGSAACWGGATVLTKGALAAFDPLVLLAIQLSASVAALWLGVLVGRVRLPGLPRMARAGSTGVLEPGLAYAVGVPGLALTSAGTATVIAAMEPVFILLGAWLVFGTRPGARVAACIAVAVAGVVLMSLTGPGDLRGGSVAGDGLILLGTLFAAAYVLASSRLALSMPAVLLTAVQQTVGLGLVLGLCAVALAAGWQALPTRPDPGMLALAVGSGLIQYALAFWLYIVGLKGVAPGVAGLALTTTPIFGLLGGALLLGERLAPSQALGVALGLAALLGVLAAGPGGGAPAAARAPGSSP